MMLPTHALGGLALSLAVAREFPEFAGLVLVAGLLGSVFPDLDMYVGHRKTLHFPVYYAALAGPLVAIASLVPSTPTVFAAVFLVGAAVHSIADVFGGGLEMRPWEATSDRAVYDHHRKRWIAPKHWIRYDGSPGDCLLSVGLGVPLLFALDGALRNVVLASLVVAVVYTAVRRSLPEIAAALVQRVLAPTLPEGLLERVPSRYRDAES